MKYSDLVELVLKAKKKKLDSIDYTRPGLPLNGNTGPTMQREFVAKVIYNHIVESGGQLQYGKMVIGLATIGSKLRSTNGPELRALIENLRRDAMSDFPDEILHRFRRIREAEGIILPNADENESFREERFGGFT